MRCRHLLAAWVLFLLLATSLTCHARSTRVAAVHNPTGQATAPFRLFSPDNWLGGAGNWSDPLFWSDGLPGANSDVFIGTGSDLVTLDTSSSISSLTLGGGAGNSILQGNGTAQSLLISGGFSVVVGGSAQFNLSSVTVGAASSNAGSVDLQNASAVQFAGDLVNSGNLTTHSSQDCWPFCQDSNQLRIAGNVNNTGAFAIYGSDSLTVGGAITNSGQFFIGNSALDVSIAKLVNAGTSTLAPGRNTNLSIGEVWNSGTLNIPNGYSRAGFNFGSTTNVSTGVITVSNGGGAFGTLVNDGFIGVSYGTTLTGDVTNRGTINIDYQEFYAANVVNHGTIDASDTSYVGVASLANYGTIRVNDTSTFFEVDGKMTNVPGALISMGGGPLAFMYSPELENAGSIQVSAGNVFAVGSSNSEGGYSQGAGGVLDEVIGASYFGVIRVDDAAYLDGTLRILLDDGFIPKIGSRYKFLLFASDQLYGEFALIENQYFNDGTEMWDIDYDSANGFVQLTAVPSPEPDSMLLLGSGLLAVAFEVKRRIG